MTIAATCVLFSLVMHGDKVHPGKAEWNLDGSWTVDWPMIEDVAKMPAQSSPPQIDDSDSAFIFRSAGPVANYEVLLARALLKLRASGHLLENPYPDNTCPAE